MATRLRRLAFLNPAEGTRLTGLIREGRATVGRNTIATPRIATFIGNDTKLRIGSFSSITTDALMILGGEHHTEWVTTNGLRSWFHLPGEYEDGHPGSRGDIIIGNDVWLCPGTIVRSGVTIGNGAVIGAGSVVTKDVRPYAIVAGNPAVEIRRRFSDEQIERLQRIAWWDWPDQRVIDWVDLLCSDNIDEFLRAAEDAGFDPSKPRSDAGA